MFTWKSAFRHFFVLAMTALCAIQASICIRKFLEAELVENVSLIVQSETILPPVRICVMESDNNSLLTVGDMSQSCPLSDRSPDVAAYLRRCLEQHFVTERQSLVRMTTGLDGKDYSLDGEGFWREDVANLMEGRCFVYHNRRPVTGVAKGRTPFFSFNASGPPQVVILRVENEGQQVSMVDYEQKHLPSQEFLYVPRASAFKVIELVMERREHISTDTQPCVAGEGHSFRKCVDAYEQRIIGCVSPWQQYRDDKVKNCSTLSEFQQLLDLHRDLFLSNLDRLMSVTGCAPPCRVDDFVVREREAIVVSSYLDESQNGVVVELVRPNMRKIKQAYMYDGYQLVGELGGSLGLFLGLTFLSVYDAFELVVEAVRKVGKGNRASQSAK